MPNLQQMETATRLTVVAAESAAPKLLAAAETLAPSAVASVKQLAPRITATIEEICPKLNLPFTLPIQDLKGVKHTTVENLCALGRDDFRLQLSNGRELFRRHFSWGGDLAKDRYYSFTPWNNLSLPKAWQLKRGESVAQEYPFQWVHNDQYLTNGQYVFPRARPTGGEWHKYPIDAVPKQHWQGYLEGLEGKFVKEMIPLRKAIMEPKPRLAAPARELTPHQKELNAFLKERKMWDGSGSEQVSMAQDGSVVFKVDNPGATPLYVVDKPGDFAIYLYREYKQAQALASGKIPRAVEMLKTPRVIHIGEVWKDNLAVMLQKMRSGEIH